jgi:hypothetical protein
MADQQGRRVRLEGADGVRSSPRLLVDEVDDVGDRSLGRGTHLRRTQARIVYLLLFIFAATIAAGFTGLAIGWASESGMKDFLAMFVPAETALLGAAAGFYFASQSTTETAEAAVAATEPRSRPGVRN